MGFYNLKTRLSQDAIQRLHERFSAVFEPEQILADENMSAHTTFRVGGAADIFVEINNSAELAKALEILKSEGLSGLNRDFYILGNGSNLLVSDAGLRGVVLHMSRQFDHISVDGTTLVCEAGAALAAIARKACENRLTGLEFAAGIPGSLGGAIVMNAGAYGGEMKQVVKSVRLMTMDGEIIEKSAEEMHFSYRHSLVKERMLQNPLVVLEVTIALTEGCQEDIRAKMDELADKRRAKQPLEYPSAGSTFKRPEGYFAAKLIEDAGLRGFAAGDAQVSEKHCGFVVNRNNATAADIYSLILEVQRRVKESSGVALEPEVILLGDFGK
ncbi:MAG: UDP-N-acetylmuramate dehydrogenase [Lachnospiraceae bacterium]|nr:UDP-N-acetylmuramate dehydrogenase [Lachnospiraceae bacterium]